MIPASAPIKVKLAPKLLPIIKANMPPTNKLEVREEFRSILVNKIVMGWLFIILHVSAETIPIRNTVRNMLVDALEIAEANKSTQPEDRRDPTRINIPIINGTIFQGILRFAYEIEGNRGLIVFILLRIS